MLPGETFRNTIAGASARYRQEEHSSVRSTHPRQCSTMKPSDTGPDPPQPGPQRPDREAGPGQLDLFAERGRVTPRRVPKPIASSAALPVETLTDDELLELVTKAGPSDVVLRDRLPLAGGGSSEARGAVARFAGYRIKNPLREQLAVLDWTLLTKVETSCDRILIAGGANVEAEWEQGPAV